MFSTKQHIFIKTSAIACLFFVMSGGVFAATYGWNPMGTVKAKWDTKGVNIYKVRSGPLIIGETLASGSLLLDVAGAVGGTSFCDQNGNNCFQARDVRWRVSGSNIYNINPANVGVGQSNPAYKVDVSGEILASSYVYSSDRRLKTDITPLTNAVDIVNNLHPVSFDWKASKKPALGLIAQEVEQVLPQVVHTGTDGYKSVDYVSLIAPLIAVVKEHQTRLDTIKKSL